MSTVWKVVTNDDVVIEGNLSQYEAEVLLCRCQNEDGDCYLVEYESMEKTQ